MSADDTVFAALTSALGEGLALFGGARVTRLTQAAAPGDTRLACESTAGLPSPGQVSCGRVTYRYLTRTPTALIGLTALVGGAELPGCVADHPVGAAVTDVSGTYSQLDGLRRQLFLGTATGTALADLGRSLGVLRSPTLSSDDQYREVVKALAYARRGTVGALRQLLDALLGSGNYTLDEDPFGHPGQVIVGVDQGKQQQRTTLGKTYVEDPTPRVPDGGAFPQALPAFGHGPLQLTDPALAQDLAANLPSAQPTSAWAWTGSNEAAQVRLLPSDQGPGQVTTLLGLPAAYRQDDPALQPGSRSELGLYLQVVSPTLLASDALRAAAQIHDGDRLARWGARATATGWQLALVDQTGVALSAWVAGPVGFTYIGLQLTPKGAYLKIGGSLVSQVPRSQLPTVPSGQPRLAWGNLTGGAQAAAVRWQVRWLGLSVQPGRDYWLGRGVSAVATGPKVVRLPGATLEPRHVGNALWLTGPVAAANARGRYQVAAVAGDQATLIGLPRRDGQLVDGNPTPFFVAPDDAPLTYPDDLGKTLQIVGDGGALTSYRIAGLYDRSTGRDLATLQTPGFQTTATRARLQGGRVTPAVSLDWRLDPGFLGEMDLDWLLEDAGTVSVADGVQTARPWQALPSQQARYSFLRRRVLGGQVRRSNAATNRVRDPGPPPRLADNPLYATDFLSALETYLPQAGAAGANVVVNYR